MSPPLTALQGTDLGRHTARYDTDDVILYALTVGASAQDLDLVYERDARVLPTYACVLGLWAVEAAGHLGTYDPHQSLHASQKLVVHQPLPASGEIEMTGRIAAVYDKSRASLVEIVVESEYFSATYSIFLPGTGGWGGERGPSASGTEVPEMTSQTDYSISPHLAALYRLTGDHHPVHIDPEVAAANGFDRPILHGLCTAAIATTVAARENGAHPADLREMAVRLTAPTFPGSTLTVSSVHDGDIVHYSAAVGNMNDVITGGRARFTGLGHRTKE